MTAIEEDTTRQQPTNTILDTLLTLTEDTSKLPVEQKQEYLRAARSQIDLEYKSLIPETHGIVQSDETIVKTIQRIAFLYEQFFLLNNDQFHVQYIANIIVDDLRNRKFPKTKYSYVYEALHPFRGKYSSPVDHSSIRPDDKSSNQLEDFYKVYAHTLKERLDYLSKHYSVDYLPRRDTQNLQADMTDLAKKAAMAMLEKHIPAAEIDDEDTFNLKKEKAKESAIRYPETIPAKTILSESMYAAGKALIDASKVVEEEGVIDPISGKTLLTDDELNQVAEGFQALEFVFKPVLDRKFKRDLFQRYRILKDLPNMFKRSAAKKYGAEDLHGNMISLTREIIGSWQTDRKIDFDKAGNALFKITDFFKIWYVKVRVPRGAQQSKDLSDILSESAFGRDV